MVKYNVAWEMVTWEAPYHGQHDGQTRLKTSRIHTTLTPFNYNCEFQGGDKIPSIV